MTDIILEWLLSNKIEMLGAILGILYIYFSINQNILTWPTGLLTSILYIIVFFRSKLYADMSLQVYYVVISIYGWYFWLKGKKDKSNGAVPVRKTGKNLWLKIIVITGVIYIVILYLLKLTDSDIAHLDSMTTALSITATWMLAKKFIEHWLIWIFVDLFSSGMYVYKNLWPTVILFLIYAVMAYFGYIQWKKDFNKTN